VASKLSADQFWSRRQRQGPLGYIAVLRPMQRSSQRIDLNYDIYPALQRCSDIVGGDSLWLINQESISMYSMYMQMLLFLDAQINYGRGGMTSTQS
jgi:hypothetical protein